VKKRLEDDIHHSLERGWCICQPERHDEELEETLVCLECHLLHICRVHADLVVAGVKIKLGEVLCAAQLIQQLLDDQDREFVPDHLGIKGAIVNTETT
jgi:hypothetical protein